MAVDHPNPVADAWRNLGATIARATTPHWHGVVNDAVERLIEAAAASARTETDANEWAELRADRDRWKAAAEANERAAVDANTRSDSDVESLRREMRAADYRWGKRLQELELRADRAVAVLRGQDPRVMPVLDLDIAFLTEAAKAAPVAGLASVAIGACANVIEALVPIAAGTATMINSRADAIAGLNIMFAQLALLCDSADYRSEYEFHLQMLRERHAKATEQGASL